MKEYTMAEAGALIGRSSSTLKHQARKGVLKARLIGKTWIVSERELRRYAATHRTPPIQMDK